jgi:hypothetical protein
MEKINWLIIGIVGLIVIILGSVVLFIGVRLLQINTPADVPQSGVEQAVTVEVDPVVEESGETGNGNQPVEEETSPSSTHDPTPEVTPTLEITATAEFTPTPEPFNRCQLFDAATPTLTLHDVPLFTTDLTYYVDFGFPVPGLEEGIAEDQGEWLYTAILGGIPTDNCTYRDYTGRIYCRNIEFPSSWWGTVQPLEVYVNGCDQPIFTHDRVSILKPTCETSMGKDACEWTGGKYECSGGVCECVCP